MASMSTGSLAAIVAGMMILSGCNGLPLGVLGGGGPNVAANVQAGRENRQTALGIEQRTEAGRDIVTKELEAGPVDNLTINNEEIPAWVLLVALLGWLLPSPGEMGRGIYGMIKAIRRKE